MGVAFGGEEHEGALQTILDATKKAGKTAAIYCERKSTITSLSTGGHFVAHTYTSQVPMGARPRNVWIRALTW